VTVETRLPVGVEPVGISDGETAALCNGETGPIGTGPEGRLEGEVTT